MQLDTTASEGRDKICPFIGRAQAARAKCWGFKFQPSQTNALQNWYLMLSSLALGIITRIWQELVSQSQYQDTVIVWDIESWSPGGAALRITSHYPSWYDLKYCQDIKTLTNKQMMHTCTHFLTHTHAHSHALTLTRIFFHTVTPSFAESSTCMCIKPEVGGGTGMGRVEHVLYVLSTWAWSLLPCLYTAHIIQIVAVLHLSASPGQVFPWLYYLRSELLQSCMQANNVMQIHNCFSGHHRQPFLK